MSGFASRNGTRLLDRAMEYALYFMVVGVSISNAFTEIGVGAVLLLWILRKATLKKIPTAPQGLVWLGIFLFLAYAVSLIHSEYLAQSVRALFSKTGKYLLLMLAIAEGVKEKRIAIKMALILCLTATFLCWDGFYQFFSGRDLLLFREAGKLDVYDGVREIHTLRVTATFPAANTFASYLVPVLMLGLALSFFYRVKTRKIAWGKGVFLGSMVACLLLTFSRGGLLACSGSILMLIFLVKKKILWIIPIVFLVAFLFGRSLYGNRAAQRGAIDPTVKTRIVMLKDATRMFQSHLWTGIGLNTYYKNIEKKRAPSLPATYAHNSYIQMIAEVGIVGFMSFMALMIYWFGRGMGSFRKLRDPELKFLLGAVLAGVLGLCIHALFDTVLFSLSSATLFWILLGYGTALVKLGSENNAS